MLTEIALLLTTRPRNFQLSFLASPVFAMRCPWLAS